MEPSSVASKDNDEDSWYGVQDPRKRKQIQDRLAQRARRKRLAEASKKSNLSLTRRCPTDQTGRSDAPTAANINTGPIDMTRAIANAISSSSTSGGINPAVLMLLSAASLNPRLPRQQPLAHDPKMSVIIALWVNGYILGMSCDCWEIVKSSPQPDTVPQVLHPSPLQMSTPHYDWIDRWPFPRMRDNLIVLNHVINADELYKDFFSMKSFSVREGALAWDPGAWQTSAEFQAKWGYLFC